MLIVGTYTALKINRIFEEMWLSAPAPAQGQPGSAPPSNPAIAIDNRFTELTEYVNNRHREYAWLATGVERCEEAECRGP